MCVSVCVGVPIGVCTPVNAQGCECVRGVRGTCIRVYLTEQFRNWLRNTVVGIYTFLTCQTSFNDVQKFC